jgi:hypothetical protein
MQVNRGLVFWGIALITAGSVALAIQVGAIEAEAAREVWQYWPVVLIVIGLAIIAARTPFALVATIVAALAVGGYAGTLVAGWSEGFTFGCSGGLDETTREAGSFGGAASVELEFNCGDLAVSTADGSDWSVEAQYASDAEPEFEIDDDSVRVRAEGGAWFTDARQAWDVVLPTGVDLALEVSANAATTTLDLADAVMRELRLHANAGDVLVDLTGAEAAELALDANAGSVSVIIGEGSTSSGTMSVNAGSIELCAADGVAFAITIEDPNVTFSHNLDDSGLSRTGDTWSAGGGDADVELDVNGNAGSFTLNPDGGCE